MSGRYLNAHHTTPKKQHPLEKVRFGLFEGAAALVCGHVCVRERERERDKEHARERKRKSESEREMDTERERQRERGRERESARERVGERE